MSKFRPPCLWRTVSSEALCIRIILFVLLFFMYATSSLFSQSILSNGTPKIKLIGRAYPDSIVLRWAATTPKSWDYTNKHGFEIERYTLIRGGLVLNKPERIIVHDVFKPLPLDEWEPLFKKGNKWAAIAAQALYGETFKLDEKSTDLFQIVNKVQELESRFSFALFSADLSLDVAKASGLWLTDKSVKKDERYLYRIYPASQDTQVKIDTGFVYIGLEDHTELPVPIDLSATFSDHTVLLKWNKEYFEGVFTAYYVERSDDGHNFDRITKDPVTQAESVSHKSRYMIHVDSLPQNNREYVYRVRGVTPFGEISEPSKTVVGKGSKALKEFPKVTSYQITPKGSVILQWTFAESLNEELRGFVVQRAQAIHDKYKILTKVPINAMIRQFIDNAPDGSNYYKIKAIKKNGEETESFPYFVQLQDSIPPKAPDQFAGIIDSTGIVTLRWKANQEKDLFGYRVFRANFSNDEYTQITVAPIKDTVFTDTISTQTLTKNIYYKITAVDQHFNPSLFSKSLALKRPDLIPPVPPVISDIRLSDKFIVIQWVNSSSDDVTSHVLYRRCCTETEWDSIAKFDNKQNITQYIDREVDVEKIYEYTMIAVDDSSLESSQAQPVSIKATDSGLYPAIHPIRTTVDRSQKYIALSWVYAENDVDKFLIYRSTNKAPIRLYKSIPGNANEFKDSALTVNTIYKYSVKACFKNGASSHFSKEIDINY